MLGLILGFLLLQIWDETTRLPDFRGFACVFATVALLSFGTSAYAVAQRYPTCPAMIPAARYPHGAAQISATASDLLAAYPMDPRAHLLAGVARLQQHDRPAAEHAFRDALSLAEGPTSLLSGSAVNTIRGLLAVTVLDEGRRPEAIAIAQPVCAAKADDVATPQVTAALATYGLCAASPGGTPSR